MSVARIVDVLKQMLAGQLVAVSDQADQSLVIDRNFVIGATLATKFEHHPPARMKRTWRLRKVVNP